MALNRILIANRGEIAMRIAQTAAELGIETVAIHAADDAASPHLAACTRAVALPGSGPRAYLDAGAIVALARAEGCDGLHPGYGFLSENADFAQAVEAAGIAFVGPTPDTIRSLGDKVAAKALARDLGVPVIEGLPGPATLEAVTAFFATQPEGTAMMLKAVAGGGGRGMRIVTEASALPAAFAACQAEAKQSFGSPDLYGERVIEAARHVEVQILGDGTGAAVHLGERECSLQRRHQKIIEIAPCPGLDPALRARLCDAALELARATRYRGLGTFEFLIEGRDQSPWFIEANPRLQVEHTITEELFDIDLVALQLRIAGGETLAGIGLAQSDLRPGPGFALQARILMEELAPDGSPIPVAGRIGAYAPPSGPGLRVDGFAGAGYRARPDYDPLLAKLIVRSRAPDFGAALDKAGRALARFDIQGIATNIPLLRALLAEPALRAGAVTTAFVTDALPRLVAAAAELAPETEVTDSARDETRAEALLPPGQIALRTPLHGMFFQQLVAPGDAVTEGQPIAIMEALKMEHVVRAERAGHIGAFYAAPGEALSAGQVIAGLRPDDSLGKAAGTEAEIDLDAIRPELAALIALTARGQDAARPEAVAKRHARGKNTARENLANLCDPAMFEEFGALTFAAQTRRRSREELIDKTLGDGVITGFGAVNAALFAPEVARTALVLTDYTVLAGTQGQRHHQKLDRIFELAERSRTPVILFAEGGGGRPGDTDSNMFAGLDVRTFASFARLAGKVPTIGVVSGPCFAGNAALLGSCDIIIGTEDMHLGMAGPAMVEAGGLGRHRAEDIGPLAVQTRNGVVDIAVADETEAAEIARRALAYLQGPLAEWQAPDARRLRWAVPENRKQVYDIRALIEALVDAGSFLELRRAYGAGIVTGFARIEGRPFGLMANDCAHDGGAIGPEAARKAARFLAQCDRAGLAVVSLVDTPGFLVGPEVETRGQVREVCALFLEGARLSVPVFGVVLRKGYGLGAMSMVGGGFHETGFTIAWPTGEFGGMGLEGAVTLGYRKELDAAPADQRAALFETYLAELYERGKATSIAAALEIDAVIDPAETRRWIVDFLRARR